MNKTTVYLPDDLKRALKQAAARRGISEAEVIRSAIQREVGTLRPRPRAGLFSGDGVRIDWNSNDHLKGFGER